MELITIANFATWPIGVAIVWGMMTWLKNIKPDITPAWTHIAQVGFALLWTIIGVTVFSTGTVRELVQLGFVNFFLVAGSQYWGYQLKHKLVDQPRLAKAAYEEYPDQGSPEGRV